MSMMTPDEYEENIKELKKTLKEKAKKNSGILSFMEPKVTTYLKEVLPWKIIPQQQYQAASVPI